MVKNLKIGVIVQARVDSKRFPNKILQKIRNISIIELIVKRLKTCKNINDLVVAIPSDKKNDKLANFLKKLSINTFRGSKNNVLSRYFKAASLNKFDVIVRVTSDCPLVDPVIVDKLIKKFISSKVDYLSNINPPTFPDGLDVEVFSFKALKKCIGYAREKYDLEHVTSFIRKSGKFRIKNLSNKKDYSKLRLTIDLPQDLVLIKRVIKKSPKNIFLSFLDIERIYKKNPSLFELNSNIKRNEGSMTTKSQNIWREAKELIPGGNMLLSKRPELFLPNKWPVYFNKAKGCKIWDIDGNLYYDFSFMGVGTNILGYSNNEINRHVNTAIKKSNVSSLNCHEEVKLAKKLIDLHPWSQMVKFARTGGEANSLAIRIARAASKKDSIAFCGYHGWHDWYLSANLTNKKNLNNQLLTNLTVQGVPRALKNTAFPFAFNDYQALVKIVAKHKVGIIKMEVFRNIKPEKNFLKKVRSLATKKNIILIFDECTSGFRENLGGLHKKYGVNPDMAIFGKSLGNGHAITAVLGKKKIMDFAQNTFISSTFWTERSGPAAALKTLELMEKKKSWLIISKIGKKIKNSWKILARKNNLKIKIFGLSSICSFEILSPDWLKYKTLISQEMLKRGFLAANTIYVCIEHNDRLIKKYLKFLNEIFKVINECEQKKKIINNLLETDVCHTGLKRLN